MAKLQSAEEELLRVLDEKRGLELELRCVGVCVVCRCLIWPPSLMPHIPFTPHITHHTSGRPTTA